MLHTPAMHTQRTLHNVTTTSEHHTPHRLTPSMYNSEHYCVYCAVKCLPTWKCPNSTDAVNCEIIWQSISDTWKWSMSNTCLDYKPWPECFKLKTSHMVFTTNVCTFLNHSPSYFCVKLDKILPAPLQLPTHSLEASCVLTNVLWTKGFKTS